MSKLHNMMSTIPFPMSDAGTALALQQTLKDRGILVETRGDYTQIVQAHPEDFEDNRWYVVIHTGNILGMVKDLVEEGLLS